MLQTQNVLGYTSSGVSKLQLYETYHGKLLPYFGSKGVHLQKMDCEHVITNNKTSDLISDFRNHVEKNCSSLCI